MADSGVNAGTPIRFENAGKLGVYDSGGTTRYTVSAIIPGSLKVKEGGTEGIPYIDRGQYTSNVLAGDERLTEIEFKVRPTKTGITSASAELIAALTPADASGKKTLYKFEFEVPDSRGGSTGTRVTYDKCWLAEPIEYAASGSGQNTDELTVKLKSLTAVGTKTAY